MKDFRSGKQGVTALAFLAITMLAQKGKYEFRLNEVYDVIKSIILNKLSSRPSFLSQDFNIMSLGPAMGRLCDIGVIEKIMENPAKYRIKLSLEIMYRYAGEMFAELLS